MIRKARAAWRGTGRDGSDDLSTDGPVPKVLNAEITLTKTLK